jgi:hypothetical protein
LLKILLRCGWSLAEGFQIPGRDPSKYRNRSAEAERMHPLDVPGHGDETPLAADAIEPAQQELAESPYQFDDAEHRLRGFASLWIRDGEAEGLGSLEVDEQINFGDLLHGEVGRIVALENSPGSAWRAASAASCSMRLL